MNAKAIVFTENETNYLQGDPSALRAAAMYHELSTQQADSVFEGEDRKNCVAHHNHLLLNSTE
jgi:hypothetical protein